MITNKGYFSINVGLDQPRREVYRSERARDVVLVFLLVRKQYQSIENLCSAKFQYSKILQIGGSGGIDIIH